MRAGPVWHRFTTVSDFCIDAKNDLTNAESYSRKAVEIREAVFGPEHPETATSVQNLATVYRLLKRFDRAEELLQQVLKVRQGTLGPGTRDTAASLNELGNLYLDQHVNDRALDFYEKAFQIRLQSQQP
jgi:tetratricopeptide (TPR) repeat protein